MPCTYTLYHEQGHALDTHVLPIPIMGMDGLAEWAQMLGGTSVILRDKTGVRATWKLMFLGEVCTLMSESSPGAHTVRRVHMGIAPRWVFDVTDDLPCDTHVVDAEPYGVTRVQHRWVRLEPVTGHGKIIGRNLAFDAALIRMNSGRAVVVDRVECFPVAHAPDTEAQPA